MTVLLLLVSLSWGAPQDAEYRATLRLLYDGSTDTAIQRFAELATQHPDDALARYFETLALVWKVEQQPDSRALDPELERRIDRAIALANARLAVDPGDSRALLARAGAHGVRGRLHLFRLQARPAVRASVSMRQDLLQLHQQDPEQMDVCFGLGLYDYYVETLPRPMKLLRFLTGLPGGDRRRGLAWIEEAKHGSLFHRTEARAQLFDIYVWWDPRPDRALEEMRALRRSYPGSPLWALRLLEHLRDRLGLYAESAAVAEEILAANAQGHPNYAAVVAQMARVGLGEAQLLDLRLDAARDALSSVTEDPECPDLFERAQLLLGRVAELNGDRQTAERHFERAQRAEDRSLRRTAAESQRRPLAQDQVRARRAIAAARRAREAGQAEQADGLYREALAAWPDSEEARLRVAEVDLAGGRLEAARRLLEPLAARASAQPPWVRPWALLLWARTRDLDGDRAGAVVAYKQLFEAPFGQDTIRALAARGLAHRYVLEDQPEPSAQKPKHQK